MTYEGFIGVRAPDQLSFTFNTFSWEGGPGQFDRNYVRAAPRMTAKFSRSGDKTGPSTSVGPS